MNCKSIFFLGVIVISISGCAEKDILSDSIDERPRESVEIIEETMAVSLEEKSQQLENEIALNGDGHNTVERIIVEEASPLVGNWYTDKEGIEKCDIYVEIGNISKEECNYFTEFFQKNLDFL